MFENRLKRLFAEGKVAYGAGIPEVSEYLAKFTVDCGIDFLWIDLEHRPYGPYEVRWLPIICRQAGCSPMIRVPGVDPIWTKKALDIGANTIMVPQVNNADEAKRAVEYAKYPPEGSRGISPLWTALMDYTWQEYLPEANAETAIVIQVESPEGMENLDEISAVEGVDVVFAGPADLSASMGIIGQFNHPDLLKYLADFPKRVAEHGKPSGITYATLEQCEWAHEQGYQLINIGTLIDYGREGMKAALAKLRDKN